MWMFTNFPPGGNRTAHSRVSLNMVYLKNGMLVGAGAKLYRGAGGGIGLTPVNAHFCVPDDILLPYEIAADAGKAHPRGVKYQVPASYRAAAHALANPGSVVSGFGALALYGLPVLADACDTVLISPKTGRRTLGDSLTPGLVRGSPEQTWRVFCAGEPLDVVTPALATAQALKEIRQKRAVWRVETIDDNEVFVRAVQLVDATRRFLGLTPGSILAAGRQRIDVRWLTRVIASSSAHADSPKETEMRLILRRVADAHGLTLVEQVECRRQGQIVTRLDLALLEPKYGYMFDGAHHWTKAQRVKDARINVELGLIGVTPLRFATDLLHTIPAVTAAMLRKDGFL